MTAAMAVTLARRRFRIGLSLEHDLFWLRLAFPWDRKSAPRPTGGGRGALSLTPPKVADKPHPASRARFTQASGRWRHAPNASARQSGPRPRRVARLALARPAATEGCPSRASPPRASTRLTGVNQSA